MQGEAIKHSSTWKKFTGKIILTEMWLQSFNVQAGMNKNNHFKILNFFFFNQIDTSDVFITKHNILIVCVFENKMFMYIRPIFIYKYKNFVMWSW